MFDDQPTQPNNQTPPNLPVGEPDDMFSRVDADPVGDLPTPTQPSAPATPPAPVEPSALDAGVLRPKTFAPTPAPVTVSQPAPQPQPMPVEPQPSYQRMPEEVGGQVNNPGSTGKKIAISLGVIVLLLAVAGGAWAFVNMKEKSPVTPDTQTPVVLPEDTASTGGTTDANIIFGDDVVIPDTDKQPSGGSDDASVLFGETVDTDGDGLTDAEEMQHGTDAKNWDTDSDNLSDSAELIWKSDPLNPDTDKDGFLDGDEVKNGYSPTGPGRIFEPPTTIQGQE